MRTTMQVVGGGLVVLGVVWILQGMGLLKGSFMTGQAFWGWMGALALLLGVPVLIRGLRRS
jgi:hypothetical protein